MNEREGCAWIVVISIAIVAMWGTIWAVDGEPTYPMTCRNCGIQSQVEVVTESDTQSSLTCDVCKHTFYFLNQVP